MTPHVEIATHNTLVRVTFEDLINGVWVFSHSVNMQINDSSFLAIRAGRRLIIEEVE